MRTAGGLLEHGALVRRTESEVGGLDTQSFVTPELVHYPTFDRVEGRPRQIPVLPGTAAA
jgi:hypothetical protein